jgi:Fic family protein
VGGHQAGAPGPAQAPAASRQGRRRSCDANDATYFILHQLGVIGQAIAALHEYLQRKAAEQRSAENLLGHALRNPGVDYSVESHRRSHRVTTQTARTDLLPLAERGLLERRKRGRAFVFQAPEDLRARIAAASKPSRRNAR